MLVGMQRLPADELREALSIVRHDAEIDNQTALRLKKQLAEEFKNQLAFGTPNNQDEAGLRLDDLAKRPPDVVLVVDDEDPRPGGFGCSAIRKHSFPLSARAFRRNSLEMHHLRV